MGADPRQRVGFDLTLEAAARGTSDVAARIAVVYQLPIRDADEIVHAVLDVFDLRGLPIVETRQRRDLLAPYRVRP